jgi:ribosome maturation factor RimP
MSNFENNFALNRAFFVCMDLLKKKIVEISSEIAEKKNLFLIDVIVRGHEKNRVIEIFYDSAENIDADTCASISREIEEQIEKNELIKGQYRLEVSSPGVDRPLLFSAQYPKHINRNFEVFYKEEGVEKKLKGRLKSIEEDDFYFETVKKELIKINFNNIIKAKVNISFS